jgi:hypothetical protein
VAIVLPEVPVAPPVNFLCVTKNDVVTFTGCCKTSVASNAFWADRECPEGWEIANGCGGGYTLAFTKSDRFGRSDTFQLGDAGGYDLRAANIQISQSTAVMQNDYIRHLSRFGMRPRPNAFEARQRDRTLAVERWLRALRP